MGTFYCMQFYLKVDGKNYSLSNNIKLQKQFNPIFAFKHICIEKTEKASTIGWIMDNCDVFSPTAHLFCIHLKIHYIL